MRPTLTSRSGRLLAASAVLALSLGLGACTIGEVENGDDDNTGAATTGQASQSESAEPTEETTAGTGAPEGELDQLVLTSADAPELGLQPVSPEEISAGVSQIGDLTEGVRVEPAHCADVNQDSLLEQTEPGQLALQAGLVGADSYAVALSRSTEGLGDRERLIEECPEMSVVFPLGEQDLVTRTVNTPLEVEAPEGVENFSAVAQDSSVDAGGQEVRSGSLLITGTVRDLGVTVTVTNGSGEVSAEARDAALDAFARQAEKVRAA